MQFETQTAQTSGLSSFLQRLRSRVSLHGRACLEPIGMALCAFLFSMVQWFGLPSPFAAAYLLAQDARGYRALFPLLGLAASLLLKQLWGVSVDWWMYLGCAAVWAVLMVRRPKNAAGFAALGGIAMLPSAIAEAMCGDLIALLLAVAAVPVAMGLTIWLRRGLDVLENPNRMPDLKDRACCALVLLLAVAGCGYLRVFNINLGYAAATLGVLLCSFSLGGLSGSFAGVMVGLALSLSGHDCRLTIAFAFGGWLAGLASVKKRRWFSALAFLFGNALALYVMPLTVGLLPYGAVLSGCALFLLTRDSACELFRAMSSPSQAAPSGAESAFLQSRLEQWEVSLRAMAGAVPVPTEHQLALGGAEELSTLLCAGCGEKKLCFGNDAEKTQARFARLWSAACEGDDALQALLPTLRGCGCIRLHALPATVEQVRVAERIRVGMRQKAELQREMNATHLTAMAENVASIRRMSAGETLGDLQASYQIGKAIHDLRFPAELDYARRVGSHLQAAITWDGLSPLGRQPEKLLRCLSKEYGLNLCLGKAVRNRLELEETPLYTAELGVASVSAGQRVLHSETPVCGDAIAVRQLRGGRYLLALSDGMGHGAHANDESHQTLELLMFALEAGYSHRQAIAVVNGIMLSASDEERFATVDLFDLDLWTGDTDSEKLGACASYLVRGNYIKRIDGSSLPLGILENVASTSQHFRMHSGDILIVVSDGVLDVLSEPEAMERVIAESIFIHPQRMADTILRNALLAANGSPKDDMTVAALLMLDRKRSDG